MRYRILLFILAFFIASPLDSFGQKVGVVLSGGGATGMAHIGVLQALEEAEIPVTYITGTSMGALIGAMYASGYSPGEIKAYVLSNDFEKLTKLSIAKEAKKEGFFLREPELNASMVNFNLTLNGIFQKVLPTNLLTPSYADFEIMRVLGHAGAEVNKDFDSLFIPFRCVASDVYKKESVVFRNGDLNAAVRASMTYPFYINPIRIDSALLFDGGLYNNFPVDILYEDFSVDYIIGSDVSSEEEPPSEDDIISQISTMFVTPTIYDLPCEYGIIIRPEMEVGTFDFGRVEEAIRLGYEKTKSYIDSIRTFIPEKVEVEELDERRKVFRSKIKPIKINSIAVHSYSGADVSFVENNFQKDTLKKALDITNFKKKYFRAYTSPQVKYIFPSLTKNSDSTFHVDLEVTKQKPFALSFGGHFSTRSVNTGYLGVSYLDMGKGAVGVNAESYFGKFYTSTKAKVDYDLPTIFPIRLSPYFVLNKWNYFKSNASFFEDLDPSFLLQNELYYGASIGFPVRNKSKVQIDAKKFINKDQYYQTLEYSESDTADVTTFIGESAAINFEYNTLNRKQWASEGAMLRADFRYVQGKEKSISGNTPITEYDLRRFHNWINLSIEGQKYFKMTSFFKIGIYGKMVFNSQSLFANYTATVLNLTEFSPLPDSRTLFMKEYRAPQYIGGGLNFIFNFRNLLELRIDPYFFQPFQQLMKNEDGTFSYSSLLENGLPMAGASLIFHSPIGPLRLSTNYFPKQNKPWVTQLSFGYIIFNKRAIR